MNSLAKAPQSGGKDIADSQGNPVHRSSFCSMAYTASHSESEAQQNFHSLALFLHPMCRVLAISQAANGRSFEFMVTTALSIAKQWRWGEAEAKSLVHNVKEYQKCTGVFAGGQANALEWWETLPVTAKQCPLKAMAVILYSVVPHAADVERYFSGLGEDRAAGRSTHRKHAHMHTQPQPGIDVELAGDLARNFTWVPPLAADSGGGADELAGPEAITDEELVSAFENLDRQTHAEENEVLEGQLYSWDELEIVNRGIVPKGFVDDISALDKATNSGRQWDVNTLLSSEGVSLSTRM
ncbi:hypothetical protein V8E55_008882 [Tylopilus felleus]